MLACAMCVTVELGFFWLAVTMAAQQATGGGGSSSSRRTVGI